MTNIAQKEYLAACGKASVDDFEPGSAAKLEFANLQYVPDAEPEPASKYTELQVQYLCGQSVEELDEFQRGFFEAFGAPSVGSNTTDGTGTAKPSGAPKLNTQKLADSGLTPTARGEVFEWFQVLEQAHREAQAGIPEHLRETRFDAERARQYVAPFLVA
ncbi:hypothetical protein [Mesorhizobium sp. M1406]|uniref:hypothetical protein n=1 Tax=Mesorhizobium sp. M1406 TaxID=2957099 RepID=UPI003336552B